jgi:hypothetical protein
MRGDLSVRINDGESDRTFIERVRGLRFTKTAPGGHHSASMRLLLPSDAFRDLGPADKVYVYDTRTGATIWEGFTNNPGVSNGPGGQEFDLSAMGGVILASDESAPHIFVDRTLDQWSLNYRRVAEMSGERGSSPDVDGDAVLLMTFPRGIAVNDNFAVSMRYDGFKNAGLLLGGFRSYTASGLLDLDYATEWLTEANTVIRARGANTSLVQFSESSAGDAFTVGQQVPRVRWRRQTGGATNIATDSVWTYVSDVWVRQLLVTKEGAQIVGAGTYADSFVYAHQVVADLVGRVLPLIDPTASTVAATTFQINQLAYHDGARAAEVLEHLSLYEPDMLWEVLHSTAAGHIFNYRTWPTTPRYEISTRDGYSAPGGEVDLCNRIAVYWTDRSGSKRTTVVTSTVPELGSRVRDAEAVTLPDGLGSTANAQRIGEQILASKNQPPKAARATVRRPIMDLLRGAVVLPWEIEPGYVVRVRETGDELRLTEVEYTDEDCSAALTLGTPLMSFDQMLAGLER